MLPNGQEQNYKEQFFNEQPFEVGYIIAYDDGRRDKIGRLPLPEPEPEQFSLFKKMIELEPSIREASYIFGSIRLQRRYDDLSPRTIEYTRDEIKANLQKLARPGIIKRYHVDLNFPASSAWSE
jgi:hypothetical protein